MQPNEKLIRELRRLSDGTGRLFSLSDLYALLPDHSENAFKSVVTRLEKKGDLIRKRGQPMNFRICWKKGSADEF